MKIGKIQDYIDAINKYVEDWYETAKKQDQFVKEWQIFFSKHPFNFLDLLTHRYFPEPYIGNPKSETFKAVFINLNPGTGGIEQDIYNRSTVSIVNLFETKLKKYDLTIDEFIRSNISFILKNKLKNEKPLESQFKDFHEKNKSEALPILYKTYSWWHTNRLMWLKNSGLYNDVPYLNEIMGLELTPWHSTNFIQMAGTIDSKKEKNLMAMWDYVIYPAIMFSRKIENGYLNNDQRSIVIAKGAELRNFFKKSGNRKKLKENRESIKSIEFKDEKNGWHSVAFDFVNDTEKKCDFLIYVGKTQDSELPIDGILDLLR